MQTEWFARLVTDGGGRTIEYPTVAAVTEDT